MTDIPGRLPGRIACGGFSLVEVVISVGIVSFCLLALLGLLSVGLQNNRDSGNEMDSVTVELTSETVSDSQILSLCQQASSS